MAIEKFKRRLASEQGFTMTELLVVLIILSILTLMAVPSYIGSRVKAAQTAAAGNVRSAILAAESYYQDKAAGNGTYNNVTGAQLLLQSPGVDLNVKAGANAAKDGFCMQDAVNGWTYSYTGGAGGTEAIVPGICAPGVYGPVI